VLYHYKIHQCSTYCITHRIVLVWESTFQASLCLRGCVGVIFGKLVKPLEYSGGLIVTDKSIQTLKINIVFSHVYKSSAKCKYIFLLSWESPKHYFNTLYLYLRLLTSYFALENQPNTLKYCESTCIYTLCTLMSPETSTLKLELETSTSSYSTLGEWISPWNQPNPLNYINCTCSKYLHTLYTPISPEPLPYTCTWDYFPLTVPWRMDQYLKSPHCLKLHELYLQQKFSSAFQVWDANLFTLFTLNPVKCNKEFKYQTFSWWRIETIA